MQEDAQGHREHPSENWLTQGAMEGQPHSAPTPSFCTSTKKGTEKGKPHHRVEQPIVVAPDGVELGRCSALLPLPPGRYWEKTTTGMTSVILTSGRKDKKKKKDNFKG